MPVMYVRGAGVEALIDRGKTFGRYYPVQTVCVRCGVEPLALSDAWVLVLDGVPLAPACGPCASEYNAEKAHSVAPTQ